MTDIGIRDISVSFRDNKISNISLVQGDALTRGFDISFVNAKGEILPVDDDYIVELVAVNSKDKDTPYACRHEVVDNKYRVMIPPETLSESGSVTIQLVFYQKSTKAIIHTIKQKCPVYQSIGQEFVESNNLYVDITALRLGLEKIEKLDSKYEEIIEKDMEIQANEAERKEAEDKRVTEEAVRVENEKQRGSNEEKREQLKTALIELKNSIESDLESINLTVDDIISSEDDRKQNEIVREEIKVELENLVTDIQNKLDNGDFVGEKGEQGIQGEQGPQGPPGEVRQEEFDNFKDANSLKIAKLEKELQNYKSTMANINVNQEVKQSVSGYGSVSLPKNTANGQVSVSVKGETVTNLFKNGDFRNGLEGIGVARGTVEVGSSGILTARPVSTTPSMDVFTRNETPHFKENVDKFYICATIKTNKPVELINPMIQHKLNGVWVATSSRRINNFDSRDFKVISSIIPTLLNIEHDYIYPSIRFNTEGAVGFEVDVKNIMSINLTQTFGAGNEPTKEQCDIMFANYFEGTKSTISASRLKSVGKNLFDGELEYSGLDYSTGKKRPSTAIIINKNYIMVEPNTAYTFSTTRGNVFDITFVFEYDENKNFIQYTPTISNPTTLTTHSQTRFIIFKTQTDGTNGYILPDINTLSNALQVEQGTTPTPYEPYIDSTQYLPNVGELRSLPNGVCDEVRVSGGKAELVKRVSDTMEELVEPITTPIEVNGTLLSYPSGTVYVEKVLPVAGIYTDEITIAHTDFPISSLDKISKIDFATGVETQLDVSKAVVATDKLSFTHADLTSGDIVFFEYFYANESTQGELELEYYDSRHVLKDSVTGKFYKIIPTVANGVLTNGLLEV